MKVTDEQIIKSLEPKLKYISLSEMSKNLGISKSWLSERLNILVEKKLIVKVDGHFLPIKVNRPILFWELRNKYNGTNP